MMGDLARQDDYDPMTGLQIGAPPQDDPRQSLPLWARQADVMPASPTEPLVGQWPNYQPPRQLPDVGQPAIPSGPSWPGNPTANQAADKASDLAMQYALPQNPLDAGLMVGGGPLLRGAGALMGSLLNPDEAEAGRWRLEHPITGHAVGDSVANMITRNRTVPTKDIFEQTIQPHDIPVGSWLTPLVGDRSRSGELLTHVGDKELDRPVWMQGGYQFMPEWKDQGVAWGSDKSPSSTIAGRVRGFQSQDTPGVYGVYTPMGPTSVDASHHMSDTLSQMMQLEKGNISKTAAEQFNNKIGAWDPNFPGVKSNKLQDYLRQQPMSARDAFVKTMNTREALDAGFPNVAQARIAVTHPSLLNVPNYAGGQSIGTMTGDVMHGSTGFGLAPHYTYRSKLGGEYSGGLEAALPKELLWRDLYPKIAARNPSAGGKIWLTGLAGEPFGQKVDRQWQDTAAEYFHKNRMGGLADPSAYLGE